MNKYADIKNNSRSQVYLPQLKGLKQQSFEEFEAKTWNSPINSPLSANRISSFTELENLKVLNKFVSFKPNSQKKSYDSIVNHSNQDFDDLIRLLDVISDKNENDNKILFEEETSEIKLAEGMLQYYQIYCKDKRPPLKVQIKRKYGKARYFWSKTIEKPSYTLHDLVFYTDSFDIFEINLKPNNDHGFFSIEALSDLLCSITISFRKPIQAYNPEIFITNKQKTEKNTNEQLKNDETRLKLKKKVEKILKNRKEKIFKLGGFKNFLSLNKNITGSLSEKNFLCWNKKIEQVLQRKKDNYKQKVEKVQRNLNRKRILTEIEEQQQFENETKEKLRIMQKFWVKTNFIIEFASLLRRQWLKRRTEAILALLQSASARLIQRVFKQKYLKISLTDSIFLHARNNLLIFHKTTKLLMFSESKSTIAASILNNKIGLSFQNFTFKVTNIQKASKLFLQKNKERIEEITKLWDKIVSKKISKSSGAQVSKYIKITSYKKNEYIKNYFFERLNEYMLEVKRLVSMEQNKNSINRKTLPDFKYLPNENIIKQMIEDASL